MERISRARVRTKLCWPARGGPTNSSKSLIVDVSRRLRDVVFFFSSDVVLLYARCRKVRQAIFVTSTCLCFSGGLHWFFPYTDVHGSVHDYMKKKKCFKRKNRLTVAYVYRFRRSNFERRKKTWCRERPLSKWALFVLFRVLLFDRVGHLVH